GLGVATPPVRIVALDDHPRVLLQLGRLEHLEQGLGHPGDDLLFELWVQPPLEQLEADERHQCSTCCEPPSGPSTRSRLLSGTWSSGTGASASINVTPPSEWSLWCRPRFTTTTSPGFSVAVSSSIVISTSPSRMNITRTMSPCTCYATSLAGSYWTGRSSTPSPPLACNPTPSTHPNPPLPPLVGNGPLS